MVLVEYSDSESDAEPQNKCPGTEKNDANTLKRKRSDDDEDSAQSQPDRVKSLPPLPSSLHSLYTTNVRSSTSDDPSLHSGRKRQTPHVEGNWPTHVYLEWIPSKDHLAKLDELISQAHKNLPATTSSGDRPKIYSFLRSDLGAQLPLHVSLSAPLVLTTATKDDFRDEFIQVLGLSHIRAFKTTSSGLRWVSNSDQTRHFLVLGLEQPEDDELNKLLDICNGFVTKYNQPQLYSTRETAAAISVPFGNSMNRTAEIQSDDYPEASKSRSQLSPFHISIAWMLENPRKAPVLSLNRTDSVTSSSMDEISCPPPGNTSNRPTFTISFDRVKLKIGNVVEDAVLVSNG